MKIKLSVILMSAGALLLVGAVALTSYNILDERAAGFRSEQAAQVLHREIPGYTPLTVSGAESDKNVQTDVSVTQMQTMEIDGKEYIGVLDIPKLSLSLPVSMSWSYPLLQTSPCRYAGSFLDNSMVIAGHNYQSHFGRLNQLANDDSIRFTDVIGNVYHYKVVRVETLGNSDVEEMTSGNWDLSLFTCTPNGTDRVTVRCMRT